MSSDQIIKPVIRPTKNVLAMVEIPMTLKTPFISRRYYIGHKALERNIYAPWGRGHASRLEGHKNIPAGNR